MRKVVLSLCMVICFAACASPAWAQSGLDQRISELTQKISNGLTENQKRTIAVVEFADLRGNVTDFGRFIAEELITHLHETKKFKVIERQLLNKIVAEQKLSLTGMIDPSSAQKLGKLLGVDAIASGTVTDLGKSLRVNARLISTSTAEIFAVAFTDIAKDDSVLALMGTGLAAPTSISGTSYQGNAIASKDIGSLRVVLKSVMPMKLKDQRGQSVDGIRCSFEFANRDTQKPIAVALNATGSAGGLRLGDVMRTTLSDERGAVWKLSTSGLTGMGIVSVGRSDFVIMADPSEIVRYLQRREDTGTNIQKRRDGFGFEFVFGSTTPISSGQSVLVTMNFVQDAAEAASGPPPKFFQITSEIVFGVETTGTRKSYSLHNVIFDRVSLPNRGS